MSRSNGDIEGTYWEHINFKDEQGNDPSGWRIDCLGYKKSFEGEKVSKIRLYADYQLIFEGRYGELVEIVKKGKN